MTSFSASIEVNGETRQFEGLVGGDIVVNERLKAIQKIKAHIIERNFEFIVEKYTVAGLEFGGYGFTAPLNEAVGLHKELLTLSFLVGNWGLIVYKDKYFTLDIDVKDMGILGEMIEVKLQMHHILQPDITVVVSD